MRSTRADNAIYVRDRLPRSWWSFFTERPYDEFTEQMPFNMRAPKGLAYTYEAVGSSPRRDAIIQSMREYGLVVDQYVENGRFLVKFFRPLTGEAAGSAGLSLDTQDAHAYVGHILAMLDAPNLNRTARAVAMLDEHDDVLIKRLEGRAREILETARITLNEESLRQYLTKMAAAQRGGDPEQRAFLDRASRVGAKAPAKAPAPVKAPAKVRTPKAERPYTFSIYRYQNRKMMKAKRGDTEPVIPKKARSLATLQGQGANKHDALVNILMGRGYVQNHDGAYIYESATLTGLIIYAFRDTTGVLVGKAAGWVQSPGDIAFHPSHVLSDSLRSVLFLWAERVDSNLDELKQATDSALPEMADYLRSKIREATRSEIDEAVDNLRVGRGLLAGLGSTSDLQREVYADVARRFYARTVRIADEKVKREGFSAQWKHASESTHGACEVEVYAAHDVYELIVYFWIEPTSSYNPAIHAAMTVSGKTPLETYASALRILNAYGILAHEMDLVATALLQQRVLGEKKTGRTRRDLVQALTVGLYGYTQPETARVWTVTIGYDARDVYGRSGTLATAVSWLDDDAKIDWNAEGDRLRSDLLRQRKREQEEKELRELERAKFEAAERQAKQIEVQQAKRAQERATLQGLREVDGPYSEVRTKDLVKFATKARTKARYGFGTTIPFLTSRGLCATDRSQAVFVHAPFASDDREPVVVALDAMDKPVGQLTRGDFELGDQTPPPAASVIPSYHALNELPPIDVETSKRIRMTKLANIPKSDGFYRIYIRLSDGSWHFGRPPQKDGYVMFNAKLIRNALRLLRKDYPSEVPVFANEDALGPLVLGQTDGRQFHLIMPMRIEL